MKAIPIRILGANAFCFGTLRDAGEHLCSAGPIISKIMRLGNGANVFAKTAIAGSAGS